APGASDFAQDLPALGVVLHDPCDGRKILVDGRLQMDRQAWVGLEVEEPRPFASRIGAAADVQPPVDVVVDELDAARPASASSGRRHVDELSVSKGLSNLVVHVSPRCDAPASSLNTQRSYASWFPRRAKDRGAAG